MIGKLFGPSAALAFSSLLAVFAYAPNAGAAVIYDYVGTCTVGCTGQASGVLTLKDSYTPGDLLTNADFEAFTYISSSTIADDARFPDDTFNLPGDDTFFRFGAAASQLPAVSGAGAFVILTDGISGGGDSFNFSPTTLTVIIDFNSIREAAADPIFTLRDTTEPPPPSSDVAEPGTLGMLAMPLLAIGFLRRRQGRGTRAA